MRHLHYPLLAIALPFCCIAKEPTAYINNNNIQILPNKGQVTDQYRLPRKDIDFKIECNGVTLFVGDGEMHYQWQRENQNSKVIPIAIGTQKLSGNKYSEAFSMDDRAPEEKNIDIYRMDVVLVGANRNAVPVFEGPTGYKENYYLAHTGKEGVHTEGYKKVTYKNVYPNIDWVIYLNQKGKTENPELKEQEDAGSRG